MYTSGQTNSVTTAYQSKSPLPRRGHLTQCSLGLQESSLQRGPQSTQLPFLQGSDVLQTDCQTHHTTRSSVAMVCIWDIRCSLKTANTLCGQQHSRSNHLQCNKLTHYNQYAIISGQRNHDGRRWCRKFHSIKLAYATVNNLCIQHTSITEKYKFLTSTRTTTKLVTKFDIISTFFFQPTKLFKNIQALG